MLWYFELFNFLVIEVDPAGLTWQSFLILNLAGLLALSFWLGKLSAEVGRQKEEIKLLREWRHDEANRDHITTLISEMLKTKKEGLENGN